MMKIMKRMRTGEQAQRLVEHAELIAAQRGIDLQTALEMAWAEWPAIWSDLADLVAKTPVHTYIPSPMCRWRTKRDDHTDA